MSSSLLIKYIDNLKKEIATKNSWGKNELELVIHQVEATTLREAIAEFDAMRAGQKNP